MWLLPCIYSMQNYYRKIGHEWGAILCMHLCVTRQAFLTRFWNEWNVFIGIFFLSLAAAKFGPREMRLKMLLDIEMGPKENGLFGLWLFLATEKNLEGIFWTASCIWYIKEILF